MRYILENSAPVLIRKVTFEGLVITNPSDDFIDANGLGYPLKAVLKLSFCNFFNILWFKTGFIKICRKGFELFFFCQIIDAFLDVFKK